MHRNKCENHVKNVIAPYFNRPRKIQLITNESIGITVNKLLHIVVIYYSDRHKQCIP